jgi:hypothetical protein
MITVQNAAGQTVFESKLMLSSPSTLFQLPLNKLAAGRYFLHIVTSESEKASASFIK